MLMLYVLLLSPWMCNGAPRPQPSPQCGYQSCPQGDPNMLNVHLLCHTHNDVGWLKTVDQYYYGAKSSIQRAGVQYIIESVIDYLQRDPSKRFIYVESAFFWRWWKVQPPHVRQQVQNLVQSGRLEFIGGGWCMNDEAAAHYNPIIDQMTYGLRFLNETFGECGIPRVAWQIDPFGHSREQASIFAQMYFDGLFHGRVDYQDKDNRDQHKTLEMVWKGSANLGKAGDIFTGILPNVYWPPAGFCYDVLCNDSPIMDDPDLEDYNVNEIVDSFLSLANSQAKHYATNHIVMTMGNDFNYQLASSWFNNLDKLIRYVNARQSNGSKVNVFYSTPSCYLHALYQANRTWTTKSDDFVPYGVDAHSYWSGYFTSRPVFKGYERETNAFLQVCKQLETLSGINQQKDIDVLRKAQGVVQHHDSITGTGKQAVNDDYTLRLFKGVQSCQSVVNRAYSKLMPKDAAQVPKQVFCNMLNISECAIMEEETPVALTIYNPIARPVTHHVRLPVTASAYKIIGPSGESIQGQIVPIPESVLNTPERTRRKAKNELVFNVQLPALGYRTYFVRPTSSIHVYHEQRSHETLSLGEDIMLGNEHVSMIIDGKTGLMKAVAKSNEPAIDLVQGFYFYRGMPGNNSQPQFRASGAYIFRPNGTEPEVVSTNVTMKLYQGPVTAEVHQIFTPWVSQVIRLYYGDRHFELEWLVGPIPVKDGIGKEIISRFDSSLKTDGIYYTDSNGREMQERRRNYRPTWNLKVHEPVAANYFPINSRIILKDRFQDLQVVILTDRSQGGGSLKDGSAELMVHRRLLYDDNLGVSEPLDEPGVDGKGLVVRGKHYILFGTVNGTTLQHRDMGQKLFMSPSLSFARYQTETEWKKHYVTEFSGVRNALPDNVHLLTLERWADKTFLLRLEHFYEAADDPDMSRPANVSLKNLFAPFDVVDAIETTLSANQLLASAQARRLQWLTVHDDIRRPLDDVKITPVTEDLAVTLYPMQIRTFFATINVLE